MKVKLTKITEGKTQLFVPDLHKYKKPEWAPVFYNPAMEKDRSNSVQLLRCFLPQKAKIADVLCGIGARGIRYANEGGFDVCLNDASPSAIKIAERNAKLNNVKVHFSNNEANKFLKSHPKKFDCMEIDPFGSPFKFLKGAGAALRKKGILCATATDIGTLGGYFPEKCMERYKIFSSENSFPSELGIRNLLFSIQRETGRKIKPIAVFARKHYIRAIAKLDEGQKNVGWIAYCGKCDRRKVLEEKKQTKNKKKIPFFSYAGVVTQRDAYAGYSDSPCTASLYARHAVKGGAPHLKCRCEKQMNIYGPTWVGKIDGLEIPYYDLHTLAKKYKKKSPKTEDIIEKLGEKDFFVRKSSLCGHGIKTDADVKDILNCF